MFKNGSNQWMLTRLTEVGERWIRMVPLIGSCCTLMILKGPCVGLASFPKYGFPMSHQMRTLSLRWNLCRMRLQFLALVGDWAGCACLRWLMAYQLVAKDVGRIMSRLKASWAGLAFKVLVWNVVLMAHITGMRSSCWAVWGYHWLEGFWWWSIWIWFHMIEEVLEIWQRWILYHCHVNNQPGRGSNRAKIGQRCKQWWCFPCFSMLQFQWNVCLDQSL